MLWLAAVAVPLLLGSETNHVPFVISPDLCDGDGEASVAKLATLEGLVVETLASPKLLLDTLKSVTAFVGGLEGEAEEGSRTVTVGDEPFP